MAQRDIAIFDLGGVLIEWDPRHLYRRLFAGDEAAMEEFLATVCTDEWNLQQDAERSFAEAEAAGLRCIRIGANLSPLGIVISMR